ncbi:MAG: hypothetical protein JNL80_03840 [Phycisphaerae bacterium]|jgi:hypothetical protein|nr:hypothetical protein [Phycisphaerae bacterium]
MNTACFDLLATPIVNALRSKRVATRTTFALSFVTHDDRADSVRFMRTS